LAMASDGVKRCFIQTAYWKRSHRGGDIWSMRLKLQRHCHCC
jgi:hypothetical protein